MSTKDLSHFINLKLKLYFKQLNKVPARSVHKMVMQETESIVIKFVLNKVDRNKSEASKILGLSRATLDKKIQLYKL